MGPSNGIDPFTRTSKVDTKSTPPETGTGPSPTQEQKGLEATSTVTSISTSTLKSSAVPVEPVATSVKIGGPPPPPSAQPELQPQLVRAGENAPLGRWCSVVRGSYKKIQNNQKPYTKLSEHQIQRLNDAGFRWCLQEREIASRKTFDDRLNDLMAFKAEHGHCDVSQNGENASLGRWCSLVRRSYNKIKMKKQMKNNYYSNAINMERPRMNLSDEKIQRLNDSGFIWCR